MGQKVLIILMLIAVNTAFGANRSWNDLSVGNTFEITQKIKLGQKDQNITLESGRKLRLLEVTPLSMIKVYLHKYRIDNCNSKTPITDLELIKIKNQNKKIKTVGIDISEPCVLEVFIDKQDYHSKSFLK